MGNGKLEIKNLVKYEGAFYKGKKYGYGKTTF